MRLLKTLRLPRDAYFPAVQRKDLIVLHHTVGGSAASTVHWWKTDPRRIGTAYLVERTGTVYEVFPPGGWAYHVGVKGTRRVDRRSIGIEIASEGGLLLRGGQYYCFDRVSERTLFSGAVYDHGSTWRQQYRYFAAYTPRQVAAVIELVSYLVAHWKIPQQTPRNHTRADLKGYLDYQGILAHCHLRPDKTDVHPGFPWLALATECKLRMTP